MDHRSKFQKIWTAEVNFIKEDLLLNELVQHYGKKKWKLVSNLLSLQIGQERQGKQCRERWTNNLDPERSSHTWSENEIKTLFHCQSIYGNSWSQISECIPGKSQNAIKNCFYSTIRRNIRRFNKGKLDNEKIKGPIDKIIKIDEIRQVLATEKKNSKKLLMNKILSKESIKLMNEISLTKDEETEDKKPSQEMNFLDDFHLVNFDDLIDLYFDSQNISL